MQRRKTSGGGSNKNRSFGAGAEKTRISNGSCGSFSMVIFQSPGVTTVSSWCSKTRELHGFFRGSAVSDIVLWNRMMSYSALDLYRGDRTN
ncbi:hypothetical protein YC2023_042402 [Brassica napus]